MCTVLLLCYQASIGNNVVTAFILFQKSSYAVVQELVICGANLNMADSSGNNVFHYASGCPDCNIVQVRLFLHTNGYRQAFSKMYINISPLVI